MEVAFDPEAPLNLQVGDKDGEGPRPVTEGHAPFSKEPTSHDYDCSSEAAS